LPERGPAQTITRMWETVDPNGRIVEMSLERWSHNAEAHPELLVTPTIILSVVAGPDQRIPP
jgi:hypothetical protein